MTTLPMASFDLETRSKDSMHSEYALCPWMPGMCEITSAAFAYTDKDPIVLTDFKEIIKELKSVCSEYYIVFCHNVLFDLSVLLANGADIGEPLNIMDSMLLAKWFDTARVSERKSFSLVNLMRNHFGVDHPLKLKCSAVNLDEWISVSAWAQLKKEEIANNFQTENTLEYNKLDAVACLDLGAFLFKSIIERYAGKVKVIKSILKQQNCLLPICKAYLRGIHLDQELLRCLDVEYIKELKILEKELNLPGSLLASPKQLSKLIFEDWKIPPQEFSEKTGAASTSKSALKFIADKRVQKILKWKETKTLLDKFVTSPIASLEYVNKKDVVTHPSPSVFGTYTGRMTYNSKTLRKYLSGIAIHQIPRNPKVRNIIIPPEGHKLIEYDASAQEIRLLAWQSGDETLIKLLKDGKDVHSYTGSVLAGVPYDEFMAEYKAGNPKFAGDRGFRYCGKFINLSCQYRIGKNSLAQRARVNYGLELSVDEAQHFKDTYIRAYPGIKRYWETSIQKARELGYAETLGGRRIYLDYLKAGSDTWSLDSTAINFPIQGSGADMKEVALEFITAYFSELKFYFDLHDGLWFTASKFIKDEYLRDVKTVLDNSEIYESVWDAESPVPIIWDVAVGSAMGNMKSLNFNEK